MLVRLQIIEDGAVTLDTYQQARNEWVGLHGLLEFEKVSYDPSEFAKRGDWAQFTRNNTVYRSMSNRRFG